LLYPAFAVSISPIKRRTAQNFEEKTAKAVMGKVCPYRFFSS
jgi:hypothetical protein